MFMAYLLWGFVVSGGLLMGLASLRGLVVRGFDLAVALNAVVYLGTAAYAAPKLSKLLRGPAPKGGGHGH